MKKMNSINALWGYLGAVLLSGSLFAQNSVGHLDNTFYHRSVYQPTEDIYTQQKQSDGVAKAGGDTLWKSDFSTPETDWITGQGDAGVQGSWEFGTVPEADDPYFALLNSPTEENGYAFFNAVQYWDGTQQAQNPYLRNATAINLSAYSQVELSFYQGARKFVSAKMFVDISTNGGASWTSIQINSELGTNEGKTEHARMVISTGNSSEFYFRFRWDDTGMGVNGGGYGWSVDDVAITEVVDIDLGYDRGFYHMLLAPYTHIPRMQVQPIDVHAYVTNYGQQKLNNVKLVLSGATSEESPTKDIESRVSDSLIVTFTPPKQINDQGEEEFVLGEHSVKRSLTMTESPDEIPENNVISDFLLTITDTIYALDHAPYRSHSWNPYVSLDAIATGASYEIFSNQTLTAVDIKINPDSSFADGEVLIELYKYTGNSDAIFGEVAIASSNPYVLGEGPWPDFISIPFTEPVELTAGEYLALVVPTDSARIRLMAGPGSANGLAKQGWYKVADDQVWGVTNRRPAVRLNFGQVPEPLPICVIMGGTNSLCIDSTMTLKAMHQGGDWSVVNGTGEATVSIDGIVTGKSVGEVTVSYGGDDAPCRTVSRTITIKTCTPSIPPPPPGSEVGLNDIATISTVELFPNPANDQVNVQFELLQTTDIVVELTDLSGRVVHTVAMNNASVGTNNATLDLSTLDNGIYMVVLRSENAKHVTKLIKQ